MLQPNLHRVDYRLMFPALHTALLTRRCFCIAQDWQPEK
jgi:hypothetical protein